MRPDRRPVERSTHVVGPDGVRFRDLNGNGQMDPYEDPRLGVADRTEDLLARLSLEEKVGLMFHTVIEVGEDGGLLEGPGRISKSGTEQVVIGKRINHFNVHALVDARAAARWSNAIQALAETSPHGIPVTISTDPRHSFQENAGDSFAAGPFSQWPEPLGLAALRDPETVWEFADIARQEYLAVGIRAALHPTVDLATEPRWARQHGTFGQDPALVTELGVAYLRGFQGHEVGPASVACTTKHFPGGGPQQDGEDAHFPYGREQVYPAGRFADHLAPFRAAIEAGTAAIMPYYGMPVGLVLDGEAVPAVGFGFNRRLVHDLLRGELGYDGVVLTDWELVNDNHVGDQVLPARAWGVEELTAGERLAMILDAGADQLGGEECIDLLLDLVRSGRVSESRIDASARRLLRVKFALGLFDDPYVDEDAAAAVLGDATHHAAGLLAQSRSVTVLRNEIRAGETGAGATGAGDARAAASRAIGTPVLPIGAGLSLYVEGIDHDVVRRIGHVVARAEDADVALIRVGTPFDPRSDLFLEAWFHQGSLDFAPGFVARLAAMARTVPVVLDVFADRPPVLTPVLKHVRALTVSYGTSDVAWLAAVTGAVPPVGRLPFDLPRSMESVRRGLSDRPGSTDDPLFRFGDGLDLA